MTPTSVWKSNGRNLQLIYMSRNCPSAGNLICSMDWWLSIKGDVEVGVEELAPVAQVGIIETNYKSIFEFI